MTATVFYILAGVMLVLGLIQQFLGKRRHGDLVKQLDGLREQIDLRHRQDVKQAEEAADEIMDKTDPADVADDFQHTIDKLRSAGQAKPGRGDG